MPRGAFIVLRNCPALFVSARHPPSSPIEMLRSLGSALLHQSMPAASLVDTATVIVVQFVKENTCQLTAAAGILHRDCSCKPRLLTLASSSSGVEEGESGRARRERGAARSGQVMKDPQYIHS